MVEIFSNYPIYTFARGRGRELDKQFIEFSPISIEKSKFDPDIQIFFKNMEIDLEQMLTPNKQRADFSILKLITNRKEKKEKERVKKWKQFICLYVSVEV